MSGLDLTLSPTQQELLRVALNSNQPISNQRTLKNTSPTVRSDQRNSLSFTPGSMSDQTAPGSGHLDFSDDSPYLDFGIDGEVDDSFNYDEASRMIGDLPEDDDTHDLHEKRKSIGDGDNDDEGGGKRREGDDRTSKKPGRKPLTSEPTTVSSPEHWSSSLTDQKRKAQNRAAQRAFRERKERRVKDLETKVEDLEKASESTTQENSMLRAEVERLQVELKESRKRLSWVTSGSGRPRSIAQADRSSLGGNDFSFEFPKFGDLPTANFKTNIQNGQTQSNKVTSRSSTGQSFSASPAPITASRNSPSSTAQRGPRSTSGSIGNSPMANTLTASPTAQTFLIKDTSKSVDSLSGLFSPSILQATRQNSTGYFPESRNNTRSNTGRQNTDSMPSVPIFNSTSSSNTDSPGSSSEAHQHLSSIGTSPEPLFNSPINKQDLGLQTINESNPISNTFGAQNNFSTDFDASNFDWLAQQNGGNFDPVLFGDYRETQDNILSQDFGSFFNEAYPLPDLGSPMHNYGDLPSINSDTTTKSNLIRQVDAAKEGEDVVPGEKAKMLTCNKIWDRLQSMEKFRNGEIDIDNLCSELRSKAKCSEGGAVVDEKHVNKILGA